jgi:hypothetical protein
MINSNNNNSLAIILWVHQIGRVSYEAEVWC